MASFILEEEFRSKRYIWIARLAKLWDISDGKRLSVKFLCEPHLTVFDTYDKWTKVHLIGIGGNITKTRVQIKTCPTNAHIVC